MWICNENMIYVFGGFLSHRATPSHPFLLRNFHYKPSMLGYPHFGKPPFVNVCIHNMICLKYTYIYILYIILHITRVQGTNLISQCICLYMALSENRVSQDTRVFLGTVWLWLWSIPYTPFPDTPYIHTIYTYYIYILYIHIIYTYYIYKYILYI